MGRAGGILDPARRPRRRLWTKPVAQPEARARPLRLDESGWEMRQRFVRTRVHLLLYAQKQLGGPSCTYSPS